MGPFPCVGPLKYALKGGFRSQHRRGASSGVWNGDADGQWAMRRNIAFGEASFSSLQTPSLRDRGEIC